jgi:hypothetical protein
MGTITVLDPAGRASCREFSVAPRLCDLNGRVLGILWNGKPNGDILLGRIQEAMTRRFNLSATRWWKKPAVDVSAGKLLAELATGADFIINGQGD